MVVAFRGEKLKPLLFSAFLFAGLLFPSFASAHQILDFDVLVNGQPLAYVSTTHQRTVDVSFTTDLPTGYLFLDLSGFHSDPAIAAGYANIRIQIPSCTPVANVTNLSLCLIENILLKPANATVNVPYRLYRGGGSTSGSLTHSFTIDDERPRATGIATSTCDELRCYIGDGLPTNVTIAMENGLGTMENGLVFFRLGSHIQAVDGCEDGACVAEARIACRDGDRLDLALADANGVPSQDDAGNLVIDEAGTTRVVCDAASPAVVNITLAGDGEYGLITNAGSITITARIREAVTHVTMAASTHQVVVNASENATEETLCVKTVNDLQECVLTITGLQHGRDRRIPLRFTDEVGHVHEATVAVPQILRVANATSQPDFFTAKATGVAPERINRVALGLALANAVDYPLFVEYTINRKGGQPRILEQSVRATTCQVVLVPTTEPVDPFGPSPEENWTATPSLFIDPIRLFEPFADWDEPNRLDASFLRHIDPDELPQDLLLVRCNLSLIVEEENTYYPVPEVETLYWPIRLRESALGDPGTAFLQKIKDEEDYLDGGLMRLIDYGNRIMATMSQICELEGVILRIHDAGISMESLGLIMQFTGLGSVIGQTGNQFWNQAMMASLNMYMGRANGVAENPAGTAANAATNAATNVVTGSSIIEVDVRDGDDDGFADFLEENGIVLVARGDPVPDPDVRAGVATNGLVGVTGMAGTAPAAPTTAAAPVAAPAAEDGPIRKMCRWLHCETANRMQEDKNKDDWLISSDDEFLSGVTDAASENAMVGEYFTDLNRPDVSNSIIMSLATQCWSGVVYNLNKYRQIDCGYLLCLKEQAANGASIAPCEEAKGVKMCRFILGEVFELPYVRVITNLMDNVNRMIQAPISLVFNQLESSVCQGLDRQISAKGIACHMMKTLSQHDDFSTVTEQNQLFVYPYTTDLCKRALCRGKQCDLQTSSLLEQIMPNLGSIPNTYRQRWLGEREAQVKAQEAAATPPVDAAASGTDTSPASPGATPPGTVPTATVPPATAPVGTAPTGGVIAFDGITGRSTAAQETTIQRTCGNGKYTCTLPVGQGCPTIVSFSSRCTRIASETATGSGTAGKMSKEEMNQFWLDWSGMMVTTAYDYYLHNAERNLLLLSGWGDWGRELSTEAADILSPDEWTNNLCNPTGAFGDATQDDGAVYAWDDSGTYRVVLSFAAELLPIGARAQAPDAPPQYLYSVSAVVVSPWSPNRMRLTLEPGARNLSRSIAIPSGNAPTDYSYAVNDTVQYAQVCVTFDEPFPQPGADRRYCRPVGLNAYVRGAVTNETLPDRGLDDPYGLSSTAGSLGGTAGAGGGFDFGGFGGLG